MNADSTPAFMAMPTSRKPPEIRNTQQPNRVRRL